MINPLFSDADPACQIAGALEPLAVVALQACSAPNDLSYVLQVFHSGFVTSMLCSAGSCDSPNPMCCISVVVFIKQICNLIREWHQICMMRPVYHKTMITGVNYISILDYFN